MKIENGFSLSLSRISSKHSGLGKLRGVRGDLLYLQPSFLLNLWFPFNFQHKDSFHCSSGRNSFVKSSIRLPRGLGSGQAEGGRFFDSQ